MKVTEVTVLYGGKLNLGDFNSAHIEMTASALPEEGETAEEVRSKLLALVQEGVQSKARELFARRGARVDEIFAGLPVEAQKQVGGNHGN